MANVFLLWELESCKKLNKHLFQFFYSYSDGTFCRGKKKCVQIYLAPCLFIKYNKNVHGSPGELTKRDAHKPASEVWKETPTSRAGMCYGDTNS